MKLTAAARRKIPASKFAGPGRSFPLPDKNHARAALSMVGRSEDKGNLTSAQAARIRKRASAMLGKGSSAGAAY
jgi:hypothetical protein